MNDPVKVIFRFKNNNRRIQFHQYIFVGEVKSPIMTILTSITNLSLFNTFDKLNKNDYVKLEKEFGEWWYKKFFNTHHINFSLHSIRKTPQQKNSLMKKYGQEWYNKHIESDPLVDKKIFYKYHALIKDELERRELKKVGFVKQKKVKLIDYTTQRKREVSSIYKSFNIKQSRSVDSEHTVQHSNKDQVQKQKQDQAQKQEQDQVQKQEQDQVQKQEQDQAQEANYLTSELSPFSDDQFGGELSKNQDDGDDDGDGTIEFDEGLDLTDMLQDEAVDMDEIEQIYKDLDVEIDNNVSKTSQLIKKALKDDKIFKKVESKLIDFDISKDNVMYNEQLKNVYKKHYVTNQYIFKDDTIKTIKSKICCSIKNNKKFGIDIYIPPSRQYLWSEYYYDGKIDPVMVGQKWIKRTELLKIDVVPHINFKVFEELRGNMKFLRDNLKRYGSKIKREDDDYNILYDYDGYYTNNDIYLMDLYNELGKDYSPNTEELQNISDVYMKIYFPKVNIDDIPFIIDFLNGKVDVEKNKIMTIYENINNDLILENQIMKNVESVREIPKHKKLFKENFITQSVIHVALKFKGEKIDLFRIFEKFNLTDVFPFIQYQTPDGNINFKYSEKKIHGFNLKKESLDVLAKWFENAPYGISFKMRTSEKGAEKFMAINLNSNGRLEYKTQWKEEDMATINDIHKTYDQIRVLLKKINEERNKTEIEMPKDYEFKYAFINSIQKFILPEKFIIDHNDLSEFSRYFFPYIALVIEPRKRQAKIKKIIEKSKFGTYLRYKRVSKYENQARMEQRILYFMRNYEYNDELLANEISKQFNITLERSINEIERVRKKYPKIKRTRKILKKLENIPKYKPPGIGIDIQGKQRERYKIRISGARDQYQLERIISFMNILIYLYAETYLYKRKDKQNLKDKLKSLTNIAKRRNRVDDFVNYDKEIKTIKQMAQVDKKRVGYTPEKGQNQYSRNCQQSGEDKRRRPQQFTKKDDLFAQGFKFDKTKGLFEKKVMVSPKGKTKTKTKTKAKAKTAVIIRAVGLEGADEEGNPTGTIYYSCNPKDNGEHMFVGFLSRSKNPYGQCMPCCFKKDPYISKNKSKIDFFLKCIGKNAKIVGKKKRVIGDVLYVLQDTNKIQEGRLGFMQTYLDYLFNQTSGKTHKIKNHYLTLAKDGYFFKLGSRRDEFQFLNAIGAVVDLTADEIKNKLIDALNKDKQNLIFTAINNGDIRTRFQTKEEFINFIKTSSTLDFDIMNHFLSIPGIIYPNGLNIVVFFKKTFIISKTLEKEQKRDDFTIMCQNLEEVGNIKNPNRNSIFIIRENKNYYPVVLVTKKNIDSKDITVQKLFRYEKDEILNLVSDFYFRNCRASILEDIKTKKSQLIAKDLYKLLIELDISDFGPKYQIIDSRYRCKYIIVNNGTIIPTKPSGSIHNLKIGKSIDPLSMTDTIKNLDKLYSLSEKTKKINTKIIGAFFETKDKENAKLVALMTNAYDTVPIIEETVPIQWINKQGYVMENKPLSDKIDKAIEENRKIIDKRITDVNYNAYYTESYELFRLELSDYLNRAENEHLKKRIKKIIADPKKNKDEKKQLIRSMLYHKIDKNLYDLFQKISQTGGTRKFVHVLPNNPDISKYQIKNDRQICDDFDKNRCIKNAHCHWSHDKCHFALTKPMIINFVNKVSEELINNRLKSFEILQKDNYFVSDIVDRSRFTHKKGQKIIKSTNFTITKVLKELFGKERIPTIGKRRGLKMTEVNYMQLNLENPLKNLGDFYMQKIVEHNLSIFRAFANAYFWAKQQFYDLQSRNLGYYSELQTNLANYFKSEVIEWLLNEDNSNLILKDIGKYIPEMTDKNKVQEFVRILGKGVITITNCVVELYVLNKKYNLPIIIYNDNQEIIYIYDNGLAYDRKNPSKNIKMDKYKDKEFLKLAGNIKFSLFETSDVPVEIEVIYYK